MSFGAPSRHLRFIWVSKPLEQKIRGTALRAGIVSVVLALILGIMAATMGVNLPTYATNPLTMFTLLLGGFCTFCYFSSGVIMVVGRSCVSAGYLNITTASQARRTSLAFWVLTIVFSILGCLNLMMTINASGTSRPELEAHFTWSVFAYMLLLVGMIVLTGINYFVSRRFFKPSSDLLRTYGVSGQIVGPTQFGPSQQWGPPQGPPPQGGPPPPQWGPPPSR